MDARKLTDRLRAVIEPLEGAPMGQGKHKKPGLSRKQKRGSVLHVTPKGPGPVEIRFSGAVKVRVVNGWVKGIQPTKGRA